MVKECIVKLNNEAVTVVKYGDVDVQLPAIHKEAKTIFVNCENGKYTVVDKDYKQNGASIKNKSTVKKTTVEEATVVTEEATVEDTIHEDK